MQSEKVRRLHAPQWRAAGAKEQIKSYFEALGLPGNLAASSLLQRLQDRFPEQFEAFGEVVEQRAMGFDRGDIYALKNVSLDFSLLTGAAFRGGVHRVVMRWVAERKYSPSTVLDVGCDNGVLTCFYALLWPAATITGIDISTAGIDRARELATSLGLTNVTFLAVSVEDFATPAKRGQFSFVLTTTLIHEAGYFASMESDHWFLDETFKDPGIPVPEFFSLVAGLLTEDNGRWLGAEGVLSPHLLWRWISALQGTGLWLEFGSCARLKDDEDLLSILVATRSQAGLATPAWATAYWTREKLPAVSPTIRLPAKFAGLIAHHVFVSIPDKRRVGVATRWNDPPPPSGREWERIELWRSDTLVILFRLNANMVMELHLLDEGQLQLARDSWESVARQFQESGSRFERQIDL